MGLPAPAISRLETESTKKILSLPVFVSSECGGIFQGTSGSIRYPVVPDQSYSHNMDCVYLIRVPADKVVNITFTRFELEQSSTCSYDWVQVRKITQSRI